MKTADILADTVLPVSSTSKPFIEANTVECTLEEIREKHAIPVFHKDNEPVISHLDFISATHDCIRSFYSSEYILEPSVRVSHPIMGRVPSARDKPANELKEEEKTLFYERMAFIIEVPSIQEEIEGNTVSLTIGGVKAHNLDNLHSKMGADQHFKMFIGFQNKVCTNLCVFSDGYTGTLKVKDIHQLKAAIKSIIEQYNAVHHLFHLKSFLNYTLTEAQFAHLIGKCRLYQHLPNKLKREVPNLMVGDSQISIICRDYYRDSSFCKDEQGNINLWKLYNLFTGANKSSYIDNFLDRGVNAFQFTESLKWSLENKGENWFLN